MLSICIFDVKIPQHPRMKKLLLLFAALTLVFASGFSQTIAYEEDFETTPYAVTSSGSTTWDINTRLQVSGLNSDSCVVGLAGTSYLTTDQIVTTGNSSVILEFSHICKIEFFDAGQIEYSIDGGTTWTALTTTEYIGSGSFTGNKFTAQSYPAEWQPAVGSAVPTNSWWKTEQFDLSALAGNQADLRIRFVLADGNNNGPNQNAGWYIDDIKVTIAVSELTPPVITMLPTIWEDTVYNTGPFPVNADITDASGLDTTMLVYWVNSGTPDTLTMVNTTGNEYQATIPAQTLNDTIEYYIYVTDASAASNSAREPSTGEYWMVIKENPPPPGCTTPITSYPFIENMETFTVGSPGTTQNGWYTTPTTGYRWQVNSGGTSSSSTGPLVDHTLGTSSGIYMYTEASSGIQGDTANLYSPCLDLTSLNNPVLSFWYHMYGSTIDSLQVNIWYGNDWVNMHTFIGQQTATQADPYQNLMIDLGPYKSITQLRFRAYRGSSYYGDISLDDIMVFDLQPEDVAMIDMTEPVTPASAGLQDVKVRILNFGTDTLTSATINWSIDGVVQTPFSWTGSLPTMDTSAAITVGTYNFITGFYNMKFWTTLPNGVPDPNTTNDTIEDIVIVCGGGLAGNFTLDPATPTGGVNFESFEDAKLLLETCGISDTTIINVFPGTYDLSIAFDTIPGASDTASVVFRSSTGLATDVILTDSATSSVDFYILKFNGSKYMEFRAMTFEPKGISYGHAIEIANNSSNIRIDSNIFNGVVTTSATTNLCHIFNYSSSLDTNIIVSNNSMYNASYAIYYYGIGTSSMETGNVFENNLIKDFYYYGIYSYYQEGFQLLNNEITTNTNYASPYGLGLRYNDKTIMSGNTIYVPAYYGVYFYYCDGDAISQNEINNNFISVGSTGTSYPFYSYYSTYSNFYHNTFNSYGSSTGRAMYLYYGNDNDFTNNIFSSYGGGYAIYSTTTSFTSDYNNFYTNGSYLGYLSGNQADITAWQTASSQDANSVSIYPNYFGMNDLHTIAFPLNDLGTPIGITEDIDGDIRSLTNPDMGADEFTPPPYDAVIVSAESPIGGCSLGIDSIKIKLTNNGIDTINSGLTAWYDINGTGPVSEVVSNTIPPGDTVIFTFSSTVDLTVGALDSVFEFEFYVSIAGDPIQMNDSLLYTIISLHSPQAVIVSNATIPYGTSTTLTATCPDTIQWYSDPLLTNLLHTGPSYTTPPLYDTTIYYVASTSGIEYNYTFDSDLNGWTATTPCSSYTTYNWVWDSDGGNGTAFMLDPSTTSSAALVSPVLNVFGDSVDIEFTHKFETESCCDHGYVAYRIDGGAWTHFTPTTGLYNGSGGLSIDPLLASCVYGPTVGYYTGSSAGYMTSSGTVPLNGGTTIEFAFAFSSDGSVSGTGWYIDEVKIGKDGCPGTISEDTVFITGFPTADVGVIEIIDPNSGIDLSNSEPITFRVVNWGSDPQDSIPVNLMINGGTVITDTIFATIPAGDSLTYAFIPGADLSSYTTYNLAGYTSLATDAANTNDTAFKTVTNSMLTYCFSSATSTGYEDLTGLGIGTTLYTNAATGAMYTDYTGLPPFIVAPSATYDITVMSDFPPGYSYSYTCWTNVFIDYNYDGDFDDPGELVFGSTTSSSNTVTGSITIPSNPHLGLTRVRVVLVEGGSSATTGPCGTYTWGETEDYMIMIIPPIPNDAGVLSITSPDFIQSEGNDVPVEVEVKNFGTDTLYSIPIEYVHNGGAPVPYTWTGTLYPGDTVDVTLPDVTVQVDSNSICAYTVLSGDSNTFNDDACDYFYGLPPIVLFEDDMENGTLLTPDAGTTYWQWGVPSASVINYAHSGDSVWATILHTNYANNIETYLELPPMTFAGISDAYLTFYYWVDSEENTDGGYAQYSLNNGFSWLALGGLSQPDALNWYDSYLTGATPGWSLATGEWKPAFIKLTSLNGMSNVKIRFGFKSNSSIVANGMAIDDIMILAPQVPVDAGVISIDQPTGATSPGSPVNVNVTIQNFGSDTLTSIPLTYTINTGYPPQSGTWTGTLAPGATTTYSFTSTYNGPAQDYRLCAFTSVSGDPYPSNDSTCLYIPMGQADTDAGITAILNPVGTTVTSHIITVQARIKNFGTQTLTSIPLIYKINGITQASETWTGTLNSGDSVTYTFTTTYQGPIAQYNLCVKTNLGGDQVTTNDEICESILTGIEETSANGVVLLQNLPNPANDETEIRYTLPEPGTCRFTVRNALGEIVYGSETSGELGINKLVINTMKYEQGIYFYTLEYEDVILTRRFTVLH
ncbi:MAG: hypothetical protein C0592_04955 [Marinilabiliales bacterium]|nr:MAG: hypothetical protein C0592_04955 [Marinilabiliales bacterium]